ncbi:DUF6009 family protein [Streptomyces sp. MJM1172]|uniref:DUF6009 family protein n=1 Tax=Streptomyces sp. MJM1172 TaxID=1703926 RepID=UPI003082B4F3
MDGASFLLWLLPQDRDTVPDGRYATGAPAEAVDPTTRRAGSRGRKTERSEKALALASSRRPGPSC